MELQFDLDCPQGQYGIKIPTPTNLQFDLDGPL